MSNLGYEGFPQHGQGQMGDRYGTKDIAVKIVKKALDRKQKRLAKNRQQERGAEQEDPEGRNDRVRG